MGGMTVPVEHSLVSDLFKMRRHSAGTAAQIAQNNRRQSLHKSEVQIPGNRFLSFIVIVNNNPIAFFRQCQAGTVRL